MGNVTRKSAYKGIELKCRDSDRVKTFCDAAIDSSIELELRWTKWDRENLLHETLHEFEKKSVYAEFPPYSIGVQMHHCGPQCASLLFVS